MSDLDLATRPPPSMSAGTPRAGVVQSMTRELAVMRELFRAAKENPRDEQAATAEISRDFTDLRTAEQAQYAYARGGSEIAGLSIHAAHVMASRWGNLWHGWREISRGVDQDGKRYSEIEAFCWDLQATVPNTITFVCPHWRDTKSGGYPLRDERDVYELCANQAARRKRQCILNALPPRLRQMATEQAETTLATKTDITPEGLARMVEAFKVFDVTLSMIERRIQRKLEAIRRPQAVELKRIWASLNDGMSSAEDWFERDPAEPGAAAAAPPASGNEGLKATLAKKRGKAEAPAAPAPAPAPTAGEQGDLVGGVGSGGTDERAVAPTAEQLREQVMRAANRDDAWLVLDRMRGSGHALSPQDHESLVDLIEQKFPE